MRNLYVLGVYLAYLGMGMTAPFIFGLGYIWVDTFLPQLVAPGILGAVPVAMIMGVAAIGGYALFDRRFPPRITLTAVLSLTLAVWVTLTTTWAAAPSVAWVKWDWAFKTILFSVFIPYLFRTRVQIEALILTFIGAALLHMLPVGAKAVLGGGRYGMDVGLLGHNVGLSESSGLATVSIMFIPLFLYLRTHSILIPRWKLRGPFLLGMIMISVATAVGTVARTAMVGFVVMGAMVWMRSRHKVLLGTVMAGCAALVLYVASGAWTERMSTIETYRQENSAYTRILMWRWTLDYAAQHPLGGGFYVHSTSRIEDDMDGDGKVEVQVGRAAHSSYFELLGEQGWPGLFLFLLIACRCLWVYQWVVRRTRGNPDLLWCKELAAALQCGLLTVMACGAFIGVSMQPMFWYLFALSTCMGEYVRRVQAPAVSPLGRALPVSGGRLAPPLARPGYPRLR